MRDAVLTLFALLLLSMVSGFITNERIIERANNY
jgi:hypothetical protein